MTPRARALAALLVVALQLVLAAVAVPVAAEPQPAHEAHITVLDGTAASVTGAVDRTARLATAFDMPYPSEVLSVKVEVARELYRVHTLPLDAAPQAVWCGDLDGDGFADDVIVAVPSLGRAELHTVYGASPTITLQRTFAVPGASAIAVADLNIDRHLDVAIASSTEGRVYVFGATGTGTFDEGRSFQVGARPSAIETANLDTDFNPDMVVANSGGASITVLNGRGDLSFYPHRVEVGGGPTSLRLVDWDRDTHMDAIVAESRNSTVHVLRNIGNGNLSSAMVLEAPGGPVDVDARDLDGDSLVDIAAACALSDEVVVWRQTPSGTFEPWEDLAVGRAPRAALGAHMNRGQDLLRDVVAICTGSDEVVMRLAEGTMNHTISYSARVGGSPVDVALGYITHDRGQEDLVVACQDPPALAIVETLLVADLIHVGIGQDGSWWKADLPEGAQNATVDLTHAVQQWASMNGDKVTGGMLPVPVVAWAEYPGVLTLFGLDAWIAPNRPPRAWAPSDVSVDVGVSAELSGAASYDPEGQLARLVWRLPDGREVEGVRATLSWDKPGTYTVLLQAFDVWGAQDMDAVVVRVNAPPVAAGEVPATARAREPVRLDAYTSSDPDGTIQDYLWDWGQGIAHGRVAWANFTGSGSRTVTLEVVDDRGSRATATYQVTVLPAAEPVRPPGEQVDPDRGEVPGFDAALLVMALACMMAMARRMRPDRR